MSVSNKDSEPTAEIELPVQCPHFYIVIPIILVASLVRTFQVTGAGYFEGDSLSTVTY
jgi:hypothetical protein